MAAFSSFREKKAHITSGKKLTPAIRKLIAVMATVSHQHLAATLAQKEGRFKFPETAKQLSPGPRCDSPLVRDLKKRALASMASSSRLRQI